MSEFIYKLEVEIFATYTTDKGQFPLFSNKLIQISKTENHPNNRKRDINRDLVRNPSARRSSHDETLPAAHHETAPDISACAPRRRRRGPAWPPSSSVSGPDATLPLAAPRPAPPRGHRRPPHSAQAPTAFAGARRPGRGDAGCAAPRLVARTESWEEDALAGAAPPARWLPRLRRGWRLQTGPRAATGGHAGEGPGRPLSSSPHQASVFTSRFVTCG